jgi:hypothetical protein
MAGGRRGFLLAVLTGVLARAGEPAAQEQLQPLPPTLSPVLVTAPAPLPEALPRS